MIYFSFSLFSSKTARNELEYVKQNNYNNREIWGSIKRLSRMSQELVTLIDPDIVGAMEAKKLEIKVRVLSFKVHLAKDMTMI